MSGMDFNQLSFDQTVNHSKNYDDVACLWQNFYRHHAIYQEVCQLTEHFTNNDWLFYKTAWQTLHHQHAATDKELTDWLIQLFNHLFAHSGYHTPTCLVRGNNEPEYFASHHGEPARIEFAHGFFASGLHEISHWCIAGKQRRQLNDFGYWYSPDGRNKNTQRLFEQVEIKPQAIECLFALALGRYFYVSQDNLNATFDTSDSTFAQDVFEQAKQFLAYPQTLPTDARHLLWLFLHLCHYPKNQHQHGLCP